MSDIQTAWQAKVRNCQYVPASELFADLSIAWRVFLESETYKRLDFGKGSHVLVTPGTMRLIFEEMDIDKSKVKTKKQVVEAVERIESLGDLWHIDLAN